MPTPRFVLFSSSPQRNVRAELGRTGLFQEHRTCRSLRLITPISGVRDDTPPARLPTLARWLSSRWLAMCEKWRAAWLLRPDLPCDWPTIPLEAIPNQGLNLEGARVSQHHVHHSGVPNPPIPPLFPSAPRACSARFMRVGVFALLCSGVLMCDGDSDRIVRQTRNDRQGVTSAHY